MTTELATLAREAAASLRALADLRAEIAADPRPKHARERIAQARAAAVARLRELAPIAMERRGWIERAAMVVEAGVEDRAEDEELARWIGNVALSAEVSA